MSLFQEQGSGSFSLSRFIHVRLWPYLPGSPVSQEAQYGSSRELSFLGPRPVRGARVQAAGVSARTDGTCEHTGDVSGACAWALGWVEAGDRSSGLASSTPMCSRQMLTLSGRQT